MSCGCGLKPNHKVDPINSIRTSTDALPQGAVDELKAHLIQEERETIPHLPIWAQQAVLLDHARFWHDLAQNRMPNRFDLEAHAAMEKSLYEKFNLIHHDLETK